MKKTIILVIILLVSLNTTFCDNNKNINIYIPNSIDIISHTITKYKNDDIKIYKKDGIINEIIKNNLKAKLENLFNEKIYIIGSDYKRKLFGIKSSNIYGEQPNWYLENNNNESLFINKDKLTRYSHNIYINSEYVIGEKTIKWFPYITDYSHSGELKPKLYILDDILLPYTFEVKLEYWNNETSKTEYKELEVVKKYSLEKITWNSNNSQILIPYFEIRMPNYFINNEYNDKQKLLINYDLLNDVMLGNSFLIYNNGNYNPFIKYINY